MHHSISMFDWQVNAAHITRLNMIPDIDSSALQVTVLGSNSTANLPVQVDVYMPQNRSQVYTLVGLLPIFIF